LKGLLLAIQFLTIIPVRVKGTVTEKDLGRSGAFFPVVGMMQGVVAAIAALFLPLIFSAEIASGLIILLLAVANGGFHLDGLADTFDAIAVKSSGDDGTDRERRLAVMKDSTTGAIGVTAIVIAILLKYLFIASILDTYNTPKAAYMLFLVPLFSKWAMVPTLFHGKPAREMGLGKIFIDHTTSGMFLLSSLIMAGIYCSVAFSLSVFDRGDILLLLLVLSISLYLLGVAWSGFCSRRFGGLTGDNIGAVGEIGDLLTLGIVSLWL
jgi:adenosylcobinamide-GDP ribazoletransferase